MCVSVPVLGWSCFIAHDPSLPWRLSCLQFQILFESLISTYSNDKLLRGSFSFSGKDSNGEPW